MNIWKNWLNAYQMCWFGFLKSVNGMLRVARNTNTAFIKQTDYVSPMDAEDFSIR